MERSATVSLMRALVCSPAPQPNAGPVSLTRPPDAGLVSLTPLSIAGLVSLTPLSIAGPVSLMSAPSTR